MPRPDWHMRTEGTDRITAGFQHGGGDLGFKDVRLVREQPAQLAKIFAAASPGVLDEALVPHFVKGSMVSRE